jgi:hypothetical protein
MLLVLPMLSGAAAWSAEPPQAASPPTAPTAKGNPSADQLLRSMSDHLRALPQFSFRAEITEEQFFEPGQRLQFGRTATVVVRRPDRLRAVSEGDMGRTQFFYDGQTATLVDLAQNRYASFQQKGSLDRVLQTSTRSYQLRAPLSHLLYSDPYASLAAQDRLGTYIGKATIAGRTCHHLAFRQKDVDWQIWIRTGNEPLPCKLVVTDKQESNRGLQFSAMFGQWTTAPVSRDDTFTFRPPAGAVKVDLAPATLPSPLNRP